MHRIAEGRRVTVPITTQYGTLDLDLSDPRTPRARAGVEGSNHRPLSVGGKRICVDLAFGFHAPSARFGLVAESGPPAWTVGRDRLPDGWDDALLLVAARVTEHLEGTPELAPRGPAKLVGVPSSPVEGTRRSDTSDVLARRAGFRLVA